MSKRRTYGRNQMQLAVEEMKTGESSLRNVAKKYNVPKSSLEFKIKNPGHKETFGPNTVLTEDEELRLVDWIKKMAQRGFPRNRENILDSVQTFLKDNPRKNPFKNNRPGHGWFQAFLKRHSDISSRTSEGVSSASSCVSEKDKRSWFSGISEYIKEKNLEDLLKDPSRIYNRDETGREADTDKSNHENDEEVDSNAEIDLLYELYQSEIKKLL